VFKYIDCLQICAHQQIEPVRLRFQQRQRKIDFTVGGKSPPAPRAIRNMVL
jgi:hypothetical protein